MITSKIDRNKIPAAGDLKPFKFPGFTREKLSNDLKLMHCYFPKMPLIDVKLILHSGGFYDPPEKEGLASLTAELITEGTKSRTATELTGDLEFIAVSMNTYANFDGSYLEFSVTRTHMQEAFEIFSDILLNPQYPEEEFDRLMKERLADRMRAKDHPQTLAREQFNRVLYDGHRLAKPARGTEQSLKSITVEDVRDFYANHYKPQNATLIVTGDIQTEELKTLVSTIESNWNGDFPKPQKLESRYQELPTTVYLTDRPEAGQSVLRLGHIGYPKSGPDRYKISIMNLILGGYFSSRINLNLREKNGYTYGADSEFKTHKLLAPFVISTSVDTRYTVPAIKEILKEVNRIRNELVSQPELEHAINYISRIFPLGHEISSQINYGLYQIEIWNLPDNYFDSWQSKVREVTAKDVLQAAKQYLHPDKMIISVVGDAQSIKEDLAKLYSVQQFTLSGERLEDK